MEINYSQSVKQQTNEFRLIEDATSQLEEILGNSAGNVKVDWDLQKDDKFRPVFSLTLKDSTGEVSGAFAPDELRSSNQTRFRLYGLWGDLLQVANRKRIERMMSQGD